MSRIVVIEGSEFTGKSTLITKLKALLEENGEKVTVLRNPGGCYMGEKHVRPFLMERGADLNGLAGAAVFMGNGVVTLMDEAIPAVQRGEVVLMDRLFQSAYAYQLYKSHEDYDLLGMHMVNMQKTVLNDVAWSQFVCFISEEEREERMKSRPEKFDARDAAFLEDRERIVSGYSAGHSSHWDSINRYLNTTNTTLAAQRIVDLLVKESK